MKTKLFLVALVGILLASCAKEDFNETKTNDKVIAFDSPVVYSNVGTKANVHGEIGSYTYTGTAGVYTYPREENFKIFAVRHNGNLTNWESATPCAFNGQVLSYDSNVDSWAPKQGDGTYFYWPDTEKMSFAAISPANLESVNSSVTPIYGNEGLSISDFIIPSDPAIHFDLMFSKRAANRTAANMNHTADAYSGIPLEFQHALTSVHFSLKKDNTVTETITLLSISLKNAKNKGTFTENIDEGSDASEYVIGDKGNVEPSWNVNPTSKEASYCAFAGEVAFPIEAQYVSALAAADGTADGDISHPLLVMPQVLADDVVLEVVYKVDTQTKTKTIQLNTFPALTPIVEWNLGYRYTYRLLYSKDTEKKDIITFSPSSEGWVDGGIIEVKL